MNVSLCLKYLVEAVDRFYVASTVYGLRKLPWLRSCSSPVLLLIAKGKLVSNHSMKLNRKILQPHLFCGVLYAYIRSDFWWCNWIWLYSSELLSSVSGEIVDLHIIWALCYVSTSRLTTLAAVCQNRYLLDEHSSWCMLFLDLKLNITIDMVFTDLWYEADNQFTCVGGMRVSA